MRRGVCPKCGTATVRAAKNGIEMGERPHQTFLRPNIGPDFRGMVRNHPTEMWTFGCISCGYLEMYVLDPGGLAFIDGNWVEVPPPPADPAPPTT